MILKNIIYEMKLKTFEMFGIKNTEQGDKLIQRLFEIIKEENIQIDHDGGYRIERVNGMAVIPSRLALRHSRLKL
jgi:hypothetical protein